MEEKIITLENRTKNFSEKYRAIFGREYRCELTKELDALSGLDRQHFYHFFNHYLIVDKDNINNPEKNPLALRVPGGTVGAIYIDNDFKIVRIALDTNYVVKTYVPNVVDIINEKYIGYKIEIEKGDILDETV